MSFSISFFARDVDTARSRLREAYAPEAVKALVELAIATIPHQSRHQNTGAGQSVSVDSAKTSNQATPRPRGLCGILVETHGHIDEGGGRSNINLFRVEPYYDGGRSNINLFRVEPYYD